MLPLRRAEAVVQRRCAAVRRCQREQSETCRQLGRASSNARLRTLLHNQAAITGWHAPAAHEVWSRLGTFFLRDSQRRNWHI